MQSMNKNDGKSMIRQMNAAMIALLVASEIDNGAEAVIAKINEMAQGDQKTANLAMLILTTSINQAKGR